MTYNEERISIHLESIKELKIELKQAMVMALPVDVQIEIMNRLEALRTSLEQELERTLKAA